MTNVPGVSPSMIARIKNILLQPAAEWEVIRSEPADTRGLFMTYVVPMAAIGPIAGLIGGQLFGHSALGVVWRASIGSAVASAVLGYILAVGACYLLGLIIEFLAPTFGANKDRGQAMKVAVYSSIPAWLAGVFQLVPALQVLSIVGLYGLYLLYLGLPKLMQAPEDKAMPYLIVTILAAIVMWIAIAPLVGRLVGVFS